MLIDAPARRVLDALIANPDAELAELAQAAQINEEVARDRLARLRAKGLYRGRTVQLDARGIGFPYEVLALARPSAHTSRQDLEAIAQAPTVTRAFTLAAEHSLAFTLVGRSAAECEAQAQALAREYKLEALTIIPLVETLSDDPAVGLHRAWGQRQKLSA